MRYIFILLLTIHINLIFAQPYGIDDRASNNSLLIQWSGRPVGIDFENAFPNLAFNSPIFLTHSGDGTDRIFVIERRGTIYVFPNDKNVSSAQTFLDIVSRVNDGDEKGLLGMAFHPNFQNNKKFYVNYTAGDLVSRISEFIVGENPNFVDPETERILMEFEQPASNHNGGMLAFGPDGYLYAGFGDGGPGHDPNNRGQDKTSLLGKILRIDVDNTQQDLQYKIPDDNPFVSAQDGSRGEIWAYGLRNPWRFSFDRGNGVLWCGDVGQSTWEEVDIITKGGNYGWVIMEGFHCKSGDCDTSGLTLPIVEYGHDQGRSIIGGYVYRGTSILSLQGTYLYGDFSNRTIWGLKYENGQVIENEIIGTNPDLITSFGEDQDGEIYVLGYNDGTIHKIIAAEGQVEINTVPESISTSGLYTDIINKTISDGLISYDLNSALWSDGVHKERLFALPGATQIDFTMNDAWQFPNESVIVKNFFLDLEKGNIESRKIVETRFLVKQIEGNKWDGFSYMWNDEETEAVLLDSYASKSFTITDGEESYPYDYYFPSPAECLMCHTPAAGYVLGPKTAQLNRTYQYESGITDNQLRTLNHINLFTTNIGEDYSAFPKLENPFNTEALYEDRARAYLDANCSHCHRPGGGGYVDMDFRITTSLENMNILGVNSSQGNLGVPDAKRVFIGDPEKSVLYLRMTRTDDDRMPPLAVSIEDTFATQLISNWIINIDPASGLNQDSGIPQTFYTKAYPNPFNPFTKIEYNLPVNALVKIDIFNILGRKIINLLEEQKSSGVHYIIWNGLDELNKKVSSGLYFYRVEVLSQTQKIIENKKLLMIK